MSDSSPEYFFIPALPHVRVTMVQYCVVNNSEEIRNESRSPLLSDYCFLDCRRLCSVDQLLAAITRAVRDEEDGELRTKSLHSEIVCNLAPYTSTREAFKQFGIAKDSEDFLIVMVDKLKENGETYGRDIGNLYLDIDGAEVDVTDDNLLSTCDIGKLVKVDKSDMFRYQNDLTCIDVQIGQESFNRRDANASGDRNSNARALTKLQSLKLSTEDNQPNHPSELREENDRVFSTS